MFEDIRARFKKKQKQQQQNYMQNLESPPEKQVTCKSGKSVLVEQWKTKH